MAPRTVLIAIIVILAIFLQGTLGFHKDSAVCTSKPEPGNQALCFREIAITYAVELDAQSAMKACNEVRDIDIASDYFNTQADLCYYDVAKIIGYAPNQDICSNIQSPNDPLGGSSVTKAICEAHVKKSSTPFNYTCNVLFVFPLVLFSAMAFKKREG